MSEPKRTARVASFACLVVLLDLGWLTAFSRAAVSTQSPRLSAEDERRTILEAERQRMSQPEARAERLLLGDLGSAMEGYYRDKNASTRSECESLLTRVLALPKPSARAYSMCAAAAVLLDRPRQAMEIVKKAIAEYPEEQEHEGPMLPLKVSGYYRIAALAILIGDVNEATRAYETIVSNAKEEKGKEFLVALSYMCLADLMCRTPGREQAAAERLRQATKMMEGVKKDTSSHNSVDSAGLIKRWAAYELAKIEGGAIPNPAEDSISKPSSDILMTAIVLGPLACPSLPELERMSTLERPSVLRDLAGFALATNALQPPDLVKAQKYLSRVAEGDSYFKVPAQAWLDHVREEIKQMHERIPALLNDLRHGSLDQQEQAASQLAWRSGPEGIKVLQNAQADPDKRVRCIAACTLGSQYQDQSVKPKFEPILEAFADDDARIRKMAQDVDFSRLEIGARELTALAKLLQEHYSKELLSAVEGCLLSEKPELLAGAAPEVAKLINHEKREIRETVLNALGFADVLPAEMAAGLARRLDEEQENNPQVQIIGMLERIGPGAKDAVPVLLKYTRHDNLNIRYLATEALKQISPGDAAAIPKTAEP
jgi:tetratricopeptide (TPR) repeat protein